MITKRQLGLLLIAIGIAGNALVFTLGRLGATGWTGIGPVERAVLLGGFLVALLGVPLLRQRTEPAVVLEEPRDSSPTRYSLPTPLLRWAWRLLIALTLLAYIAYLGVYVAYAVELFRWPYDYDQGESFELYDAVLHSQGEWPYRDSSTFPFYASNYPPLFHLLNILLFPLFGQTLLSGRVLSFVVSLLTAAMIGLTVRRRTGGWFIPLICSLAYTASNFVYHVGPLCRQHITMVLLEVAALYFIAESNSPRHGKRNVIVGLFFMLLAGYAKQLAVFTAAALFVYLFLVRPRRGVALAVAFGAVFGLIFLWINWATDGYWWINTISANVNEFIMPQLVGLTRSWLRVHTLFIIAAAAMVFYEVYARRASLYAIWFVFTLGTGMMSGKWGAGEAYWISSVAAAIILTGFALHEMQTWIATNRPKYLPATSLLIPLLLLIQTPRMLHLPTAGPFWGPVARVLGVEGRSVYADYPYYDTVGYTQVGHFMLPRDYEGGARIMAYVNAAEGLVFSEEAAFTMLAGKPVITNPTQLLNLYNSGLLDTTELEAMIYRQEFDLVIMRAQFYPPPVLAAIGQNYGLVEHIPMNGFNYIIMKPLTQTQP